MSQFTPIISGNFKLRVKFNHKRRLKCISISNRLDSGSLTSLMILHNSDIDNLISQLKLLREEQ